MAGLFIPLLLGFTAITLAEEPYLQYGCEKWLDMEDCKKHYLRIEQGVFMGLLALALSLIICGFCCFKYMEERAVPTVLNHLPVFRLPPPPPPPAAV